MSAANNPRDRGAVMVEFALILPILLMLVIGIVQFGFALNTQISIQAGAREGARALALGESSAAVDAAVNGAADNANITGISKTACTDPDEGYATVRVTAQYTFSIPFVDLGTKTLTATARMRCGL